MSSVPRSQRVLSRKVSFAENRCYLCGLSIMGCRISGQARYGIAHYLFCPRLNFERLRDSDPKTYFLVTKLWPSDWLAALAEGE